MSLLGIARDTGAPEEVLVLTLALLLVDTKLGTPRSKTWVSRVLEDSQDYVDGQAWRSPDSWRTSDRWIIKQLNDAIATRKSSDMTTLDEAFNLTAIDYANEVSFSLTKGMLTNYFRAVKNLPGVGHDDRPSRAPRRHVYLAPRIAQQPYLTHSEN